MKQSYASLLSHTYSTIYWWQEVTCFWVLVHFYALTLVKSSLLVRWLKQQIFFNCATAQCACENMDNVMLDLLL